MMGTWQVFVELDYQGQCINSKKGRLRTSLLLIYGFGASYRYRRPKGWQKLTYFDLLEQHAVDLQLADILGFKIERPWTALSR